MNAKSNNITEDKASILDSIEGLSGLEFKYIRKFAGLTQKVVGHNYGGLTQKAVSKWEKSDMATPSQALCLKSLISEELWKELRQKWKNYQGNKSDLIKSLNQTVPKKNVIKMVQLVPGKQYTMINNKLYLTESLK